jgi:hypothetical protein
MGNNLSSTNTTSSDIPMNDLSEAEKKKLLQDHDFTYILNYIATRYILTMDFQSLKNLQDPKYCDEMILLTSDIIKKYFNEREIEYLQQKIELGQQINKLTKEKVMFFNKNDLSNKGLDSGMKKNRMCIGIAKFYIKIAHIFSAIVMTVNPIYVYKDNNNQTVKKSLLEKKDIPKGSEPKIEKMGICNARFELLNIGNNYLNKMNTSNIKNDTYDEDGNIVSSNSQNNSEVNINLKKKYCNINKKINNTMKENLSDEPGIPELMNLYYDKYDYEKGEYNSMTDESRERFTDDLFLFYKHFTGIEDTIKKQNPDLDEKQRNQLVLDEFNRQGIKKFSDIKLKDYNATFENICSNKSGGQVDASIFDPVNKTSSNMLDNTRVNNSKIDNINNNTINNNNNLDNTKQHDFLKKYAENLRKMLDTINVEQEKLLNVLNEIFVYVFDSNKKQIIINPELTNESLDKIVIKTREAIIGLYLQCESDYIDGLKLYQALIESQMFVNEGSKTNNLYKERERLYNPSSSQPRQQYQSKYSSYSQPPPQQQYQSKYSSYSQQPPQQQPPPQQQYQSKYSSYSQPRQQQQQQYRPSMYDMNKQQKPDERQRLPNDMMNRNEMY